MRACFSLADASPDTEISASRNSASVSFACCANVLFQSKRRFSEICPTARGKPNSSSVLQSCRRSPGTSILATGRFGNVRIWARRYPPQRQQVTLALAMLPLLRFTPVASPRSRLAHRRIISIPQSNFTAHFSRWFYFGVLCFSPSHYSFARPCILAPPPFPAIRPSRIQPSEARILVFLSVL